MYVWILTLSHVTCPTFPNCKKSGTGVHAWGKGAGAGVCEKLALLSACHRASRGHKSASCLVVVLVSFNAPTADQSTSHPSPGSTRGGPEASFARHQRQHRQHCSTAAQEAAPRTWFRLGSSELCRSLACHVVPRLTQIYIYIYTHKYAIIYISIYTYDICISHPVPKERRTRNHSWGSFPSKFAWFGIRCNSICTGYCSPQSPSRLPRCGHPRGTLGLGQKLSALPSSSSLAVLANISNKPVPHLVLVKAITIMLEAKSVVFWKLVARSRWPLKWQAQTMML